VQDFQEFGRSIGKRYICTKLGEGAYADVFRLEPKDLEEARDVAARGGLVIKVIPFIIDEVDMVDELVDLNSITREIQVLQTMDQEHGFARCRGVNVVHGKYPDVFLDAFHMFQTADPEEAINEDPTKNIPPDQMYVILEMDDTGMPLSKLKWPSAFQVFDIFWKTTMILAHAEQKVEFEHRDLHNGNVCFKPLKMDGPIDVTQEVVENMEEEPEVILGLSNLKVTVIDYTLARAKCANPDPDSKGGDLVVFDPITFWEKNDSVGDSEADKRQYDTYRKVRDWAKKKDEQARALAELEGVEYEGPQDKYARFLPKSNVLWLGYLLADLLVGCSPQGRGACLPGSSRAAKKLQVRLWRSLEHVNRLINGASPTLIPESAEDLLASAVDTGLLSPADTAAFREQMEE
jgi:serine/threonine-protein kinase haspin